MSRKCSQFSWYNEVPNLRVVYIENELKPYLVRYQNKRVFILLDRSANMVC